VAEAGTPGVSDPGRDLIDAAYQNGFAVVPVPGPSALVAAVSAAGMSEARFVFEGFLPRRRSKRVKRLAELAADERLLVFFEAPHRLRECLADMAEVLGDRRCLVAREITKMYEEMSRGRLRDLAEEYSGVKPRGEFVIVCEGASGEGGDAAGGPVDLGAVRDDALALIEQGMKKTEAAKAVASRYGIKRNLVYSILTGKSASKQDGK
jgi:16S rRNA (cytidine1402-2'-O)-methyltransferase